MTLALARFPALVETPEGTHDRAAYIINGGTATVHVLEGGRVVEAARKEGAVSAHQQGQYRLVTFADGSTWRDGRGKGCGCGSPLKRWFATNQPRRVGT